MIIFWVLSICTNCCRCLLYFFVFLCVCTRLKRKNTLFGVLFGIRLSGWAATAGKTLAPQWEVGIRCLPTDTTTHGQFENRTGTSNFLIPNPNAVPTDLSYFLCELVNCFVFRTKSFFFFQSNCINSAGVL